MSWINCIQHLGLYRFRCPNEYLHLKMKKKAFSLFSKIFCIGEASGEEFRIYMNKTNEWDTFVMNAAGKRKGKEVGVLLQADDHWRFQSKLLITVHCHSMPLIAYLLKLQILISLLKCFRGKSLLLIFIFIYLIY